MHSKCSLLRGIPFFQYWWFGFSKSPLSHFSLRHDLQFFVPIKACNSIVQLRLLWWLKTSSVNLRFILYKTWTRKTYNLVRFMPCLQTLCKMLWKLPAPLAAAGDSVLKMAHTYYKRSTNCLFIQTGWLGVYYTMLYNGGQFATKM